MPFNSARHMRERTMPAIEAGLKASGRTRADLELTAEVIVATGHTEQEQEEAAVGVRWLLAFYGSTPAYRAVLDVEGMGDLQPELNALSKQGRWAEMAALITDDVLDVLAVRGTPAQVAAEITARYGGCDRVCAYFPGYEIPDATLADLASALRTAP